MYTSSQTNDHILQIMDGWPKALREDCFMYIHDLLLKQWPVLKGASIGCQRALCERLQRFTLCPGDMIYHAGDCVGEIYFVIRGHVKVIKNGKLIGILSKFTFNFLFLKV